MLNLIMAWFKKKDRVLDLTKRYKKQQEAGSQDTTETSSQETSSAFPSFLADMASASIGSSSDSETPEYVDVSAGPDGKKRKLAKRLMDMTTKIEDLSNQIYHLQQRIELLERKTGVN